MIAAGAGHGEHGLPGVTRQLPHRRGLMHEGEPFVLIPAKTPLP